MIWVSERPEARPVADQLHGSVLLRYEPTGLVYELDAPLRTDANAAAT